ncbi:Putative GroES-like superfamily, alcohol dehydrogenase-like, NAD(P)-binding domain superfamily [Colletotrichum destructivum]|uniref:GroES-like superfamily, alcohol dehydrogenase-like, NAD(P)-binding domain superfamily n=1 Tax=Colletotrichum destructivum TaxID=34406 RepID=A0AAX4IY68_9PEZI|nr:Putative GroES-like superfamily, alcohol dehydrogenase-like, NAD(P)-binding domain superfamily [Colletotrichum destructivum]
MFDSDTHMDKTTVPGVLSRQTAIVGSCNGNLEITNDAPVPQLEDDMVFVSVTAVALNPVDNKMQGRLITPGAIAGHDFSGTVLDLGSKAASLTPAPLAIGDRVCSAVQGMHGLTPSVGAFAHTVGASAHACLKVPETISDLQAASLGTAVATMGLALFKSLGIPGHPEAPITEGKGRHILIYGASSSVGTMAVQLAKLSGMVVIGTCSQKNFDLVKSYGADVVFDYKSKTCVQDIKDYTRHSLKFALDCISEVDTMAFCYACLGRTGGKYTRLEPFPDVLHTRKHTVTPDWVLGPSMHGKPISWPPPFGRDADVEVREFAVKWFATVQRLLDGGKLRPHPVRVIEGFPAILEGLQTLKRNALSGEKLVVQL